MEAAADQRKRAVVIRSIRPEQFCVGADLEDAQQYAQDPREYIAEVNACWTTIERTGVAVIVAVDGPAVGAGFELCLCADQVIASDRAWFSFPEVRFGLPALSAARRLEGVVGRLQARRILLSGSRIGSSEALGLGLVSQVVSPPELEATAITLADSFARSGVAAMAALKDVLSTEVPDPDVTSLWFRRALGATPS
ncbi:hypothetical protein BCM27_02535 [Gordonia terrae]|nr:hypothetical protein BCM27_02535 [Gordonia terrae]